MSTQRWGSEGSWNLDDDDDPEMYSTAVCQSWKIALQKNVVSKDSEVVSERKKKKRGGCVKRVTAAGCCSRGSCTNERGAQLAPCQTATDFDFDKPRHKFFTSLKNFCHIKTFFPSTY